MDNLYIIIDHINGEFEDLEVITNESMAMNKCIEGYIVYSVNLEDLRLEEIDRWKIQHY